MQENLLVTCQACHPDATSNFTAAWMSHYIPAPDRYPLVYYVNLFYQFFIPVVLGGMALLVVMDVSRTTINRRKKRRQHAAAVASEAVVLVEPKTTQEPAPGKTVEPVAEGADAQPGVTPGDAEETVEGETPSALSPASNLNLEMLADESSEASDEAADTTDTSPTDTPDSEAQNG
jgi:hypothetical protein